MQKLLLSLASLSAALVFAACGPVQSPECAQYIECQAAIDEDQGTSSADGLETSYGETGTCWSGSAQDAVNCTNSCVVAVEALGESYPDIAACQPDEG